MTDEYSLAALIDINDAADALEMPPRLARVYLELRHDYPVATYNGRELWLSDTVHESIADRGDVTAFADQAARAAYEETERSLRVTA